jgi:hypothetical protein
MNPPQGIDKITEDAPPVVYIPVPGIRIEATYPATDGRCPEAVTVTWEREGMPPAGWMGECINALARVPHARAVADR